MKKKIKEVLEIPVKRKEKKVKKEERKTINFIYFLI